MTGIVINTNINSLYSQSYLSKTEDKLQNTLNHLSSGLRINTAKDDAAGLAIAETMQQATRAYAQGSRNANDGISLIRTAESDMTQTLNMLQRMRELAMQASNGIDTATNLANIDTEYQKLLAEIDRLNQISNFNGTNLLQGGSLSIQVGQNNTANDRLSIDLVATDTTTLGINGTDLTTNANAQALLPLLATAINTITTGLAALGASDSNLSAAITGNDDRTVNLQAARSRIMDADFAKEASDFSTSQILADAGQSMLTQANSLPKSVTQLLPRS